MDRRLRRHNIAVLTADAALCAATVPARYGAVMLRETDG